MCTTSASVRPTPEPPSRLICSCRQPDIGAHSGNRRSPPGFGTFATLRTCRLPSHGNAAGPVDYGEGSAISVGSALGLRASASLWHGHACAGPPMSLGKQYPDCFPNIYHPRGRADTSVLGSSTWPHAPATGHLADSQTGDARPRFYSWPCGYPALPCCLKQ